MAIAYDRFQINDPKIWAGIERNIDKTLHKLKSRDFALLLSILNKKLNEEEERYRASLDIIHKILTIMPIHVDSISDWEVVTTLEAIAERQITSKRLLDYFIYPRIEAKVQSFRLELYIRTLNALAAVRYDEDEVFWATVLQTIFNYKLNLAEANELWETLIRVKLECPRVDVSRYLVLLEKVRESLGQLELAEEANVRLKIERDLSIVPSVGRSSYTLNKKVIKTQNALRTGKISDQDIDSELKSLENRLRESELGKLMKESGRTLI